MDSKPVAFVLLAHGFGAATWNTRFHQGKVIGLNEEYAYGYHHAEKMGVHVRYSEDAQESFLNKALRISVRGLLGFDLIHAWRNRQAFFAADVVWTHTESLSLAAGMLCRFYSRLPTPKLILQSVWLVDRWDSFSQIKRSLYRALLSRADVLTFLSPLNADKARQIFPTQRCELVHFGITTDQKEPPQPPRQKRPLQLLSLGNDRHRDWGTLADAVRGQDELQLTIVSGTVPKRLVNSLDNCTVERPRQNDELYALFEAADIVVVPLNSNLHASGITVLEEAVIKGKSVIVTDTGGLRAYFTDDDVWYVPLNNPQALRETIKQVASNPDQALAKAISAQEKTGPDGLSSIAFAREHARLSLEILDEEKSRQLAKNGYVCK